MNNKRTLVVAAGVLLVAIAAAFWGRNSNGVGTGQPVPLVTQGVGFNVRGGYGVLKNRGVGDIVIFSVASSAGSSNHELEMQLVMPSNLVDVGQSTVTVDVTPAGGATWDLSGNVVEVQPGGGTAAGTGGVAVAKPTLQTERDCNRPVAELHTQPLTHLMNLQRGRQVDPSVLKWGTLTNVVTSQLRLANGELRVPASGHCWSVWEGSTQKVGSRRLPSALVWAGPSDSTYVDFVVIAGRESGKKLRLNASESWDEVFLTGPEHVVKNGEYSKAMGLLQSVLVGSQGTTPWLPRCEEATGCDGRTISPGPACPPSLFEAP